MQHEINLVRNAFMLEIWSLHEWFIQTLISVREQQPHKAPKFPGERAKNPKAAVTPA